jgi:hypothetical protein
MFDGVEKKIGEGGCSGGRPARLIFFAYAELHEEFCFLRGGNSQVQPLGSYDHGRHLGSRFCLDPKDYEVVSLLVMPPSCRLVLPAGCRIAYRCPLIALSSCCLVAPTGCHIASCRSLFATPSRQLVMPACCCITSPHPLVVPHTALLSSRRAGWLLHRLLMRRPLVVSACRHCRRHP